MDDYKLPPANSADGRILMESLGITHSLADVFHFGDYRYGKLEDTVAQAKRSRDSAS
jgi:hypothetical protein